MNTRLQVIRSTGMHVCAIALMTMCAPSAWAQETETSGEGGLGEIVVTAQKRSENLQKIPIAISAVSSDTLQAAGITDTLGLSTVVPGLSLGLTSGYFQPHLRGIGTTSIGPGIENPVALYVDNVYYSSQVMGLSDMSDVKSVAVLKGPQGTLFGRNATGGVIQMTTREPTRDPVLEVRTSFDNYETSRSNLYFSGGSDAVAGNFAVTYVNQGQGYGRNVFNGDSIHRIDDEIGLRSKVNVDLSEQTTLKLVADYKYSRNSLGPNQRPFPGFLSGFPSRAIGLYDTDTYRTNRDEVRSGGISGTIEQDLGFAKGVSITAYREYRYSTVVNPYGTFVPSVDLDIDQRGRQFTQEFQLVSPTGSAVNWVAGLFYFDGVEDLPTFDTNIRFGGPGLTRVSTYSKVGTKSYAAFAQATVEIFPETNLTLGGRYTIEKRTLGATTDGFIGDIPIGPLGPPVSDRLTEKKPTWRIALDHKFSDDILGYISYNRGFKSGGFNSFTPTEPSYRSEQLDAYEVGIKSELLDRTVRLNLSGYYYDYKNIQVSRYTTTTVIFNGASAEAYGVDMDLTAALTNRLTFNAAFAYNKTEFTDFPSAPFLVPTPADPLNVAYLPATGNTLPFAPKYTLSTALDYRVPLGAGELKLNATNFWSSKFYVEPNNQLAQKAYDYLNLSATWVSPDERWSIGLWGRNLFDKAVLGYAAIVPIGGAQVDYTNPPRTYGVTLSAKFGS